MDCPNVAQCAMSISMPAKKPKRELKKPPLRRMSGEELRNWRIKHDLSQQELAELLGVAKTTISSWETGHRNIPVYIPYLLDCLKRDGYIP